VLKRFVWELYDTGASVCPRAGRGTADAGLSRKAEHGLSAPSAFDRGSYPRGQLNA